MKRALCIRPSIMILRYKKLGLESNVPTDDVVMSCRELAYQIAEQFRVLGKPLGLRDCIIVGGMGK